MPTIHTQIESARGCGYRKAGGKYLVGDKLSFACGKLPIPLEVCNCCGAGIKFSRGFTWVSSMLLADSKPCTKAECSKCSPWFDANNKRKLGLLWAGTKFYPTPSDFNKEAAMAGISKRVSAIPKGLKIGEDWILLAHNKAITVLVDDDGKLLPEPKYIKGIFGAFIPKAIEYIITGRETDAELTKLEEQGFRLVKVVRDIDSQIPIDRQLENWEVFYYKKGDRNKLSEIVKAHSEYAARQSFKQSMKKSGFKTRIMSIEAYEE